LCFLESLIAALNAKFACSEKSKGTSMFFMFKDLIFQICCINNQMKMRIVILTSELINYNGIDFEQSFTQTIGYF
tara:strand:- start:9442 stop:9666 length:225 start_codon:yes stop_codon:yes gene_type:complete